MNSFPKMTIVSDQPLKITMTQILHSEKRMIAFAKSLEDMKEAKKSVKLSSHLRLLHPQAEKFGLYTPSPIFPIELHSIETSGDILMTGAYYQSNGTLIVRSGGDLWRMGLSLTSGHDIRLVSQKNLFGLDLSIPMVEQYMDFMSPYLLKELLEYMIDIYMIPQQHAQQMFNKKISLEN